MFRTRILGMLTTVLVPAAFACMPAAHAQTVDFSNIITNADVATLSGELGQGPLAFHNIFSHVTGDGKTTLDFHAAADGQGPTFSIFKVSSYELPSGVFVPLTAIVGGYNPQSWASSGGFYRTFPLAERTGFLFNLTLPLLLRQRTDTFGAGPNDLGSYQSFNDATIGPAFGAGFDFGTEFNTLDYGYAFPLAYGDGSQEVLGKTYATTETFTNLEVFTFTANVQAAPEPGRVAAMAAFALTGAGFLRKRRRN